MSLCNLNNPQLICQGVGISPLEISDKRMGVQNRVKGIVDEPVEGFCVRFPE